MTVLTRLPLDKAPLEPDAPHLPLVDNDHNEAKIDLNDATPADTVRNIIIIRKKPNGDSYNVPASGALFFVFITAVLITSVGIIGGILIYRQYAHTSVHRYQGWCAIPYDGNSDPKLIEPHFRIMTMPQGVFTVNSHDIEMLDQFPKDEELFAALPNFLKEIFDIGDTFEKIIVSDYRDDRHSKIVHDFYSNTTGIVDSERCFVMSMNHNVVMQPDLFISTIQGQSAFDLTPVRNAMRARIPALVDLSNTGYYIEKECSDLPTYMLEKQDGTIRKRSADMPSCAKFAQFSGKHIQEIDIVNIDELLAHEEQNNINSV